MPKRWTPPVFLILLAVVAQGCTSASRPSAGGADAAAPPGTTAARVEDFIARAAVGETTRLTSAKPGGAVDVTVRDEYHAASGRVCRQLTMTNGVGSSKPRVACRAAKGSWRLLPRLRNHELPSVSAVP